MIYRFVVLSVLCLSMAASVLFSNVSPLLENCDVLAGESGTYTFYVSSSQTQQEELAVLGCNIISSGSGYFITCPTTIAGEVRAKLTNISGESVFYSSADFTAASVFEQFNYCQTSKSVVGDISCYYGYSAWHSSFVRVGGYKTNLQVAISSNGITIGFPIILGGY